MVELFVAEHGRLDVLVCNAGAAARQLIVRHRADEWLRMIQTNLTGTFHCIQAAGAAMVPAGGGSIVVIGSFAGSQGERGQAAYASAKAGLLGLVRTAGLEWGASNIRINLLYPGLHESMLAGETVRVDSARQQHLLGRSPSLGEIARTVYHLAQLKDVSGQVWNIDSRLV
jgi:3-oxoacyl-[acyl-carrier protein] reductase